jgi:hypothetical protein
MVCARSVLSKTATLPFTLILDHVEHERTIRPKLSLRDDSGECVEAELAQMLAHCVHTGAMRVGESVSIAKYVVRDVDSGQPRIIVLDLSLSDGCHVYEQDPIFTNKRPALNVCLPEHSPCSKHPKQEDGSFRGTVICKENVRRLQNGKTVFSYIVLSEKEPTTRVRATSFDADLRFQVGNVVSMHGFVRKQVVDPVGQIECEFVRKDASRYSVLKNFTSEELLMIEGVRDTLTPGFMLLSVARSVFRGSRYEILEVFDDSSAALLLLSCDQISSNRTLEVIVYGASWNGNTLTVPDNSFRFRTCTSTRLSRHVAPALHLTTTSEADAAYDSESFYLLGTCLVKTNSPTSYKADQTTKKRAHEDHIGKVVHAWVVHVEIVDEEGSVLMVLFDDVLRKHLGDCNKKENREKAESVLIDTFHGKRFLFFCRKSGEKLISVDCSPANYARMSFLLLGKLRFAVV